MFSISKICPQCRETREVELRQVFDLEAEPDLRQRFLRGEINILRCPGCGLTSIMPAAMVFKDPINRRAIYFIPDIPQITESLFRQMMTRLSDGLAQITPPDPPKYLSNPILCRDGMELIKLLKISKTIPVKETILCPECQQPSKVMLCQLFDYEKKPDLVQRLLKLELNFFDCPKCGTSSLVSIPVAVHDPAQEQFILFIPYDLDQDDPKVKQSLLPLEQEIAETFTGHSPEYLFHPVVVHEPINFFRYLERAVIKKPSDGITEDLMAMDELKELILSAMTPKQKSLYLTLLANNQEEESFNQELNKHPELMAAVNQAHSDFLHEWRLREIVENNPDFMPVYTEIAQLTQMAEMPRRLHLCYRALEMIDHDKEPEIWAEIQYTLGNTLAQTPQGSRLENLELAIEAYQKALTVRKQEFLPIQWASTQLSLSNVYSMRLKEEHAENVEKAIYHCEQSLKVFTQESFAERWAMALSNLANMYRNRVNGSRAENYEMAISYYQQSLEGYDWERSPKDWATIQHNLAIAYMDRIEGEQTENVEQAIHHCQQALEVRKEETMPFEWAMTQTNLAQAYSLSKNIKQAILHYNEALRVFTRSTFPEQWAIVQNKLAIAYFFRTEDNRTENITQGVKHCQNALKVFKFQAFPADYRQVQRNLGNIYFMEGQWAEAEAAYQKALEAGQSLLDTAYTETGRQAEVRETAQIYARCAYCQLKLGQYDTGLVTLDRGKTRLLTQVLALDESHLDRLPVDRQQLIRTYREKIRALEAEMRLSPDIPGRRDDRTLAEALQETRQALRQAIETIQQDYPDFMQRSLTLTELLALIPDQGALVAPVVTSQGSVVLVVPQGAKTITADNIVGLDEVTNDTVRGWLIGTRAEPGWLRTYFDNSRNIEAWKQAITNTLDILQHAFVKPILNKLQSMGFTANAPLVLMPQGGLGLLPIHALLLDNYKVTVAPGGYALHTSQRRLAQQPSDLALTAIINPTSDLPFTPAEGKAIITHFDIHSVTALWQDEARKSAVQSSLQPQDGAATIFHFSGHGYYNLNNPLQSGLVLTDDRLTLSDLMSGTPLQNTRLVVLSACETGITEFRQSPDEFLGLPAGFLQTGASAIISTLWAVNDLSTMLLMERFYQHFLQNKLPLPEALRQAQLWLRRDVTAGELAERFLAEEKAIHSGRSLLSAELASEQFRRFNLMEPDQRPFEHPYYWAAFTFSGT